MNAPGILVKIVVFAAFLLAMVVSGFAVAGEQSPAEHAQRMAMAGHEMTMADMGSSVPDKAQMALCKQQCLVAVATLPIEEHAVELTGQRFDGQTGADPLVSSLIFPPPGHPPKFAMI